MTDRIRRQEAFNTLFEAALAEINAGQTTLLDTLLGNDVQALLDLRNGFDPPLDLTELELVSAADALVVLQGLTSRVRIKQWGVP